jgi:hypothetical protein
LRDGPAAYATGVSLITNRGFRTSTPKAGNGFVVQLNGFVAAGLTKQSSKNPNDFSSAPQAKPQGKAFADRKPGATF